MGRLSTKPSSAIVAVTDIDRARRFYAETLGLDCTQDHGEVLVFKTGPTALVVYRSDFAGTNKANAVAWDGGAEVEAIAAELKSKGVKFSHYPDMEGVTLEGDVHVGGGMKMVWFTDPDGNILHINGS